MSDPLRADLRDRVFHAIVKERDRNPKFADVMDRLGFFTACDFIDGIVNAIIAAGVDHAPASPPPSKCARHGLAEPCRVCAA